MVDRGRVPATRELVDVTEAAALASGRQLGRSDPYRVRQTATAVMLGALRDLGVHARVVLSPNGDKTGLRGTVVGPPGDVECDLAACPLEGADLVGRGLLGAVSLIAAVEPEAFPHLPAVPYMEGIVAGSAAHGALDLGKQLVLESGIPPSPAYKLPFIPPGVVARPRCLTSVRYASAVGGAGTSAGSNSLRLRTPTLAKIDFRWSWMVCSEMCS
jgi:Bacterial fructose-1,6-bisphosphatase, glpX-encoded